VRRHHLLGTEALFALVGQLENTILFLVNDTVGEMHLGRIFDVPGIDGVLAGGMHGFRGIGNFGLVVQ